MLLRWLHHFKKAKKAMAEHAEKFPTKGVISLWGKDITWQEFGGEIHFRMGAARQMSRTQSIRAIIDTFCDKKNKNILPNDICDLPLPDKHQAIELAIVNKLLATVRPHALPDKNGYYAASAGITVTGRLFLEVNNEAYIANEFSGRGCAETGLLRKAQKVREKENVSFSSLYLMSGVMQKVNGKLVDRYEGHVSCLCGECRQNFRNHMGEGRFIMVPTNDGSARFTINKTAKKHSDLGVGEAWEISNEVLYPLPKYVSVKLNDEEIPNQGYGYITQTRRPALPLEHAFSDLKADENGNYTLSGAELHQLRKGYERVGMSVGVLKDNPTSSNINRALLQLVKEAYSEHAEKQPSQNLEITAILVKTDKGEFFPSIMVNGQLWLPSKPPELPVALLNAFNRIGISDVYMMTFDEHRLQGEEAQRQKGEYDGHAIKMPNPADLGRLIKNLKKDADATVHVIPVNDGTLSGEEIDDFSKIGLTFSAREKFGPDFANPKKTLAQEFRTQIG